jgi:predicted acyltransferase
METELSQKPKIQRLISIDVFRGMVMFSMLLYQLGLKPVADYPIVGFIYNQLCHAAWVGFHFEDVILPWFLFIIGVSMAFSDRSRAAKGQPATMRFKHAFKRAALLYVLGFSINWIVWHGKPHWGPGVLQLLAFSYFFGYLFLVLSVKKQWLVFAGLLFIFWFFVFIIPVYDVGRNSYIVKKNLVYLIDEKLTGAPSVWGYLYTIITATACVVYGNIVGKMIINKTSDAAFLKRLSLYGVCGIILGIGLHPFIPVIKRMFSPSYTLLTCGIVSLLLALCYWAIEVKGIKKGYKLFLVIGVNCIFVYLLSNYLKGWLMDTGGTLMGPIAPFLGDWISPLKAIFALVIECYLCFWLYKRKIFFKI